MNEKSTWSFGVIDARMEYNTSLVVFRITKPPVISVLLARSSINVVDHAKSCGKRNQQWARKQMSPTSCKKNLRTVVYRTVYRTVPAREVTVGLRYTTICPANPEMSGLTHSTKMSPDLFHAPNQARRTILASDKSDMYDLFSRVGSCVWLAERTDLQPKPQFLASILHPCHCGVPSLLVFENGRQICLSKSFGNESSSRILYS
jgi:hypothetical protein